MTCLQAEREIKAMAGIAVAMFLAVALLVSYSIHRDNKFTACNGHERKR